MSPGDATVHDLTLLRLIAQRVAGPGLPTPRDVVDRLTAVQAQDHPGALTSVALRTRSRRRAAVEAALAEGRIVRSWPMRGTLHLVVAEDLRWLLDLTAVRVRPTLAARHRQLGIDTDDLHRARDVAETALAGGRELSRAGLLECWSEAGLDVTGQRGYHFIVQLAHDGVLCLGPIRDGDQRFVLLSEWVPAPRVLERDEALGELARRFFHGHGPATLKDLVRWTKLTSTDAKAGIAVAAADLEELEVDGVRHWMDPATPARLARHRAAARGVFLLPGFDEYMLGYGDRTAALPAEFADRIVPGGNGMFLSTVVVDGQVVGTWRRAARTRELELSPFGELTAAELAAVREAFLALPVQG
jgi:Winged helix DNA-binding domain